MARFLVDIPEEDINRLDSIARAEGKSRAAVLREAVAETLSRPPTANDVDAFCSEPSKGLAGAIIVALRRER